MAKRRVSRVRSSGRPVSDGFASVRRGQTLPPSRSPEVYARWLFEFLRADLTTLTEGQLLGMRADAARFTDAEVIVGAVGHEELPTTEELQKLRDDAVTGLQRVMTGGWFELDDGVAFGIALSGDRIVRGRRRGSFSDQFRAAVFDTVEMFWHRIRPCPTCRQLFLTSGKRVYCSEKCAGQASWSAYKVRNPQNSRRRDYHAEYERRIQKKLGHGVKVGRRGSK